MILDGMLLRSITEKQIFSFIKLIAAAIIFYACLNYAILPVGEDFSELVQKDYIGVESTKYKVESTITNLVEQYIQEGVDEINNEEIKQGQDNYLEWQGQLQTTPTVSWHFAAQNTDNQYQDKFITICNSNTDLCGLIDRVGDYTWKEKYLYLSSIFSMVNFIQEHMVIGNDIVSVLRKITIDNSLWNRRGYATWNNIVFNLWSVQSRAEFVWLVAHELWHIYDLWALQWVSSNKHGAFTEFGKKVFAVDDLSLQYYADSRKSEKIRKSGSLKKDFCSGYGMTDPFEDFAECFNLYMNHNSLFKAMAKNNQILKKKYNFVASVFDGNFLHAYKTEVNYVKDNAGRRPWDTTRISP